jgi:hypothetical protein
MNPYVVLRPHSRGNPCDKHLVVNVREWVQVLLEEKPGYQDHASEHESYDSAGAERDRLNTSEETAPWQGMPVPTTTLKTDAPGRQEAAIPTPRLSTATKPLNLAKNTAPAT